MDFVYPSEIELNEIEERLQRAGIEVLNLEAEINNAYSFEAPGNTAEVSHLATRAGFKCRVRGPVRPGIHEYTVVSELAPAQPATGGGADAVTSIRTAGYEARIIALQKKIDENVQIVMNLAQELARVGTERDTLRAQLADANARAAAAEAALDAMYDEDLAVAFANECAKYPREPRINLFEKVYGERQEAK